MNLFDVIVIGFVLVAFLWGLSSGLIRLAAGTGGFMAGMFLASRFSDYVAAGLVDIVPGQFLQRAVAYVFIVLAVALLIKVAAGMISSKISGSALGKFDHTAGAVIIASIAIMTIGTVVHLLGAISLGGVTASLDDSLVAPVIVEASVISTSKPWCSSLPEGDTRECSTLISAAGDLMGTDLKGQVDGMLGGRVGELLDGGLGKDDLQRYLPVVARLFQ